MDVVYLLVNKMCRVFNEIKYKIFNIRLSFSDIKYIIYVMVSY